MNRPIIIVTFIAVFFELCCSPALYGQGVIIVGEVLDSASSEPIAFVNIGIEGRNVGTISNENGEFKISIPESLLNDSLTFSAVTHNKIRRSILDLNKDKELRILLKERVTDLGLVVVRTKGRPIRKDVGITKTRRQGCFTRKFNEGAQIAQLIEAKRYPVELSKVRMSFMRAPEALKIRVRVFEKDKISGLPKDELLFEDVLYQVPEGATGWIEVDVSEQSLWLEEDFYVSIEFIRGGFFIASCLDSKGYENEQWVRVTSLGTWERAEEKLLNISSSSPVIVLGAEVISYRK